MSVLEEDFTQAFATSVFSGTVGKGQDKFRAMILLILNNYKPCLFLLCFFDVLCASHRRQHNQKETAFPKVTQNIPSTFDVVCVSQAVTVIFRS